MRWERNAVGVSVNCVGSSCAVLLCADWWVSRSVDYRAYAMVVFRLLEWFEKL